MNSVEEDLRLYGNSFATSAGERLDPTRMVIVTDKFHITAFVYTLDSGRKVTFRPDEIVHHTRP